MNTEVPDTEKSTHASAETPMQRAIRDRAQRAAQREPNRFWFSSYKRFGVAVVAALALVGVLIFGVDKGIRVYRMILDLFLAERAPPPPDVKAPQMIYLPPLSETPEQTPSPEMPPPPSPQEP